MLQLFTERCTEKRPNGTAMQECKKTGERQRRPQPEARPHKKLNIVVGLLVQNQLLLENSNKVLGIDTSFTNCILIFS